MSMKKLVAGLAAAAALTALVPAASANAEPANGRFCAKADAGKTAVHNGTSLKCVQDGNRYRWRLANGAAPATPAKPTKPAAKPAPKTPAKTAAKPSAKPTAAKPTPAKPAAKPATKPAQPSPAAATTTTPAPKPAA